MNVFTLRLTTLGRLASAVMLAAVLAAGASPGTGNAQSRTSATINGKTVTLIGGSNQSLSSNDERTLVKVDGRRIVIKDGKITVGKKVHKIGGFTKIEIFARDGTLKIVVDGRPLD
jgi:hypothetical protein